MRGAFPFFCISWLLIAAIISHKRPVFAGDPAAEIGPATEKRFPPLQVVDGFKATLFACDPLIEYPSVIALGPRLGSVFVVHDYMTGLGTEIIRRDEIRLVEDTDGDGYADKSTLYAGGFNSIMGLAYDRDVVYAFHAPFLTALRDTDGDGVADERRDLLSGLGLTPEENPVRLHCANGVTVGHDGWLYLSLGDHGCDVARPEGDRLVYQGGGILRCRTDGSDLHVLSTGLRNIYDVALDEDLNVFVRDNENDGGDYMIRVAHCFFDSYHGYPYDYYERPEQAVPPIADLGRGSSAGGVCYKETALPASYRGNLFFCEWGRSVVRYGLSRAGSGFGETQEVEFAAGDETDPYGFKPTSIVVDHDGSLLVADWADGQRPKRGRGRLYRVSYAAGEPATDSMALGTTISLDAASLGESSLDAAIAALDDPSYHRRIAAQAEVEGYGAEGVAAIEDAILSGAAGVRAQLHAVWVLARVDGVDSIDALFRLAQTTPSPRVAAQAVRALADLTDPVLVLHRLAAGSGDATVAQRLAKLAEGADPGVVREVVIAFGRLRWPDSPEWLRRNLQQPDPARAHAAMRTLRRAGNWPAVLGLLDLPHVEPIRQIALRAVRDQAHEVVVEGLMERLRIGTTARRAREYAAALTRVYRKPGPWTYWGYRAAPRSPNAVDWARTELISKALDRMLADPDPALRAFVLERMQREGVPVRLSRLTHWLKAEHDVERVFLILESLAALPEGAGRDALLEMARDRARPMALRLRAFEAAAPLFDAATGAEILILGEELEDGPLVALVAKQLAGRPQLESRSFLTGKLASSDAGVRTAAIEALAKLQSSESGDAILRLFDDPHPTVRQAAVVAAGQLGVAAAIEPLLSSARTGDPGLRRASLGALGKLRASRAVSPAIAALDDRAVQMAALECLGEVGGPDQAPEVVRVASENPSIDVLDAAVRVLGRWHEAGDADERALLEDAVAELQGSTGSLLRWQATTAGDASSRRTVFAVGADARITLDDGDKSTETVWLATTEIVVPESLSVEFLAGANGKLRVDLNGTDVYKRDDTTRFRPYADRFAAELVSGRNRLLVSVTAQRRPQFHARFRRRSAVVRHERLTELALAGKGSVDGGRELFFNVKKTQCLNCHRLDGQGGRIGPELSGVGSRFSRIHLVESILQPSQTIAASYHTLTAVLDDGQIVSGVKVEETQTTLTIGDNQGKSHVFEKAAIQALERQNLSTMPEGLEKVFTDAEFVDLIAFLLAQRKP